MHRPTPAAAPALRCSYGDRLDDDAAGDDHVHLARDDHQRRPEDHPRREHRDDLAFRHLHRGRDEDRRSRLHLRQGRDEGQRTHRCGGQRGHQYRCEGQSRPCEGHSERLARQGRRVWRLGRAATELGHQVPEGAGLDARMPNAAGHRAVAGLDGRWDSSEDAARSSAPVSRRRAARGRSVRGPRRRGLAASRSDRSRVLPADEVVQRDGAPAASPLEAAVPDSAPAHSAHSRAGSARLDARVA